MKRIVTLILCLVLSCQLTFALELQDAKSQGLVGETPTGYLAPVGATVTGEVGQLVQSINQQRKAAYQKIAQRNKTSLAAVEKLAGEQALEKTPVGQYIFVHGSWQKK